MLVTTMCASSQSPRFASASSTARNGPALQVGEYAGGAVEAARGGDVDRVGDLVADREVRRDHQHAPARHTERQDRDQSGLAAADRDLLDRAVSAVGEELDRSPPTLSLRFP